MNTQDKINKISKEITSIADPIERFTIALILVEMYRADLSRMFVPAEKVNL